MVLKLEAVCIVVRSSGSNFLVHADGSPLALFQFKSDLLQLGILAYKYTLIPNRCSNHYNELGVQET